MKKTTMVGLSVLLAAGMARAADLSKVPQMSETTAQRDERMQWFRDAKFGMFIHWGPCSIGKVEIGWGRKANRPWDINGIQTPRTDDPVYDKYLLVYEWPAEGLAFDPLPNKVLAARTLTGVPCTFKQSVGEWSLQLARKDMDTPVTVIEVTLDKPLESGTIIGELRTPQDYRGEFGAIISADAKLEISSSLGGDYDKPGNHERLFAGERLAVAFHTRDEKNPWAKVDLGAVKTVHAVAIENRPNERRTEGLILSISEDGQTWQEVWRAKTWEVIWTVPLTHLDAGAQVPGRKVRFIKVETINDTPRGLLLQRITAFGPK